MLATYFGMGGIVEKKVLPLIYSREKASVSRILRLSMPKTQKEIY